jgi:hypothetical protein
MRTVCEEKGLESGRTALRRDKTDRHVEQGLSCHLCDSIYVSLSL